MAIYTAYYDSSRKETEDGSILVSALIASERKWKRFDQGWKAALAEHGVHHFHMKDFTACRREFEGWREHEDRRRSLLQSLIKATKLGINKAISVRLSLRDYARLDQEYCMTEGLGGPFVLCAGVLLWDVEGWIKKRSPERAPIHVFEAGDPGLPALLSLAKQRGFTIASQPKRDSTTGDWASAFQAADLVAWEHRRATEEIFSGERKQKKFRASFLELYKQLPHVMYIVSPEQLVARLEGANDSLPRRKVPRRPESHRK